ncbi:SPOR domain-containing protein [Luteimonas terricola]|uniref:Sporulation protein n=1 Tax=Luteimonas terricola TaxID=645597 RepID=A0ABQ2ELF2_9GAMM|nr:SPOR domain-containing protein [Luteimonas terricola]GGK15764.1 sporulation protein [Luteimonas terricola]
MAVKRGKSQARRNSGSSAPLPGWAWMVIGVLLTILVVMAAPKLFKSDGEPGFFRPTPNPDARPAAASTAGEESVAEDAPAPARPASAAGSETPPGTRYEFYDLLPGQEVAMTDAELAASARAEQERQRELLDRERAAQQQERDADAADLAGTATPATAPTTTQPAPARPAPATAPAADGARYILQAGSFASNSDAEALKARIAMLGLVARVERAEIEGRTMHRVRMGPYGTASELAEAKQKLGNGGLEALAIRAR